MALGTAARPGLAGDRRLLFGVAATLAGVLSLDVAVVRLAFVGSALAAPPLVLLYPLGALLVPVMRRRGPILGLAGAEVAGATGALGVLLAEAGALLALRDAGLTLPDPLPLVVFAAQAVLTLALPRLGRAERWGWLQSIAEGRAFTIGALRVPGGVVRLLAGLALVLGGVYLVTRDTFEWGDLVDASAAAWPLAVVLLGVAVILLPPLLRVGTQFAAERRERIRADERAKLATHLHDSVLQTLTLIQRHADDPASTATLARRQERELRDWLYGGVASADAGRLRDRLTALAAEIEDRYRWRVELIVVGDADVGPREEELLAATREAVVNAARHSGAVACDVYAECGPDLVQIFVRDRGRGFDSAAVPADRRGLADSVMGRMARVGGAARVRSSAQSGTEVALDLPAQRNGNGAE